MKGPLVAALSSLLVASVAGHGSGAWKDPNHFDPTIPFAGTRYIAEVTHKLTVVGTDDGKTWWTIAGYCEGPGMTSMHFDFSPKGGPADASAVWAKDAAGKVTMTFGDGNAWELLAETSDSAGVPPAASVVAAKPAAGSSANVNYALGLVLAVGMFGMGYFTAKKRRSNFDQIA